LDQVFNIFDLLDSFCFPDLFFIDDSHDISEDLANLTTEGMVEDQDMIRFLNFMSMRDKPDLTKWDNDINKLFFYLHDFNDEFEVYLIKYFNDRSKVNLFNKYIEKKGREFADLIKKSDNNLLNNYDDYVKVCKNYFN